MDKTHITQYCKIISIYLKLVLSQCYNADIVTHSIGIQWANNFLDVK